MNKKRNQTIVIERHLTDRQSSMTLIIPHSHQNRIIASRTIQNLAKGNE